MITLVIYDISDNAERYRIAKICKRFGMRRIQKSAFLGDLPPPKRKRLEARLRKSLKGRGNIQIFVICRADFSLRVVIGDHAEDEKIVVI